MAAALPVSVAVARHTRGLLLVNCLCFTIIGSALFGFPTSSRFSIFVNWLFILYYLFAVDVLSQGAWKLLFRSYIVESARVEGQESSTVAAPAPSWLIWSLR